MRGISRLLIILGLFLLAYESVKLFRNASPVSVRSGDPVHGGEAIKVGAPQRRTVEQQQALVNYLRRALDAEEKVLSRLDQRKGQLTVKLEDSQNLGNQEKEIVFQLGVISRLEVELQAARQNVAEQDSQVRSIRQSDDQSGVRSLQFQVQDQQAMARDLNNQFKAMQNGNGGNGVDREALQNLRTQAVEAQNRLRVLQQELNRQRNYQAQIKGQEGSVSSAAGRGRRGIQQLQAMLNSERQKLKVMQDRYKNLDKTSQTAERSQDQILNQVDAEKLKLKNLSDRYAAELEKLNHMRAESSH